MGSLIQGEPYAHEMLIAGEEFALGESTYEESIRSPLPKVKIAQRIESREAGRHMRWLSTIRLWPGQACELPCGPACVVVWREVYSVVVRNISRFTFDQKPREELWIQPQQTPRPAC